MCARTSKVASSTICTSQMKRTGSPASSGDWSHASAAAASARQRPRGAPPPGADRSTCSAHMAATPGLRPSSANVQLNGTRKLVMMSRRWKPCAASLSGVAKPTWEGSGRR